MNLDRWILIGIIGLCIIIIWKMVPIEKAREAWLLFLSLQVITWIAGLFAVEMRWIEYPVQLLPDANKYNKTSFSFEFFLFPMIAIIFSLYFPKSNKIKVKILYYLLFAGLFTVIEVILQKTTNLVMYHQWKWYWTLISLILVLYINHQYYLWFKKQLTKVEKQ